MNDDAYETASEISDVSFRPFAPSESSSRTSHDMSIRSPSPTRSVMSVTSSLRAQAIVEEYGRGFNNQSDVYRLPADDEELDRLHNQHLMLREVTGKYPPLLPQVLADDTPGETKACLDLGCGSGSWIMEVANEFPNCSAVAIDLVPLQSLDMPPNCRSEVDDVNLGLEHYYGDFNVVNARMISAGIKDYKTLIDHIAKVLRPGGLIYLGEVSFSVYGTDHKAFPVDTKIIQPPWFPLWIALMTAAMNARGATTTVAGDLVRLVTEHGAFEHIVDSTYFIPLTPSAQGDDPEAVRQRWIGELGREDTTGLIHSTRPLLLACGLGADLVCRLQENAINELKEGKTPYYMKFQTVYALKKHPVTDGPSSGPATIPATSPDEEDIVME